MTNWTKDELDRLVAFAGKLADAASEVTLKAFRAPVNIDNKLGDAGFDPVTEADKGSEAAMRALINTEYPDHGIEGEEYGLSRKDADWRWILDPIDGTRAFISGLPTWGTLIALAYKGEPVIGVIDQPYLKERYVGTPSGSTLNGTPIQTRPCPSLGEATLSTTDPALFSVEEKPRFDRLAGAVRLTRYGLDCYAYAIVASGHMDVVIEAGLSTYDMAALIPVIAGAGGICTDYDGQPAGSAKARKGQILVLGDPARQNEALALLRG